MDLVTQRREALFDRIVEALDHLPRDLREVFILSHYENRGHQEIADLMRTSPEALEELLDQANELFFRNLRLKA